MSLSRAPQVSTAKAETLQNPVPVSASAGDPTLQLTHWPEAVL